MQQSPTPPSGTIGPSGSLIIGGGSAVSHSGSIEPGGGAGGRGGGRAVGDSGTPGTGPVETRVEVNFAGSEGPANNQYANSGTNYLNSFAASLSLPQGFVNFSSGLGDALLLGTGRYLRSFFGIDGGIDQSSRAYTVGSYSAVAAGGLRLGYAAVAKGYSLLASSGIAASSFRTALGNFFRFGRRRPWQPDLAKYATDSALRSAAGRTNPVLNVYAAGVIGAGVLGPGEE